MTSGTGRPVAASYGDRSRFPSFVVVASILLLAASVVSFAELYPARLADFRAFYCSGAAVLVGADPYREHPLHDCEHELVFPGLSALPDSVTVPAPFPGAVLGLFAALGCLPFPVAVAIWLFGSVVAIGASIRLCTRLTATSWRAVSIAVGFPALIVALPLGQLTPFVLLALLCCAALMRSSKPRLAAFAAFGTALDPQVGVAVWLALFINAPSTRGVLSIGAFVTVGFSLLVTGPDRQWEYLFEVLPAHVIGNVPEASQFSVANLVYGVGASREFSIALGNVWYAAAVVIGILVARCLRSRLQSRAVVLIPPAFAVFGGTHTHLQQLSLAMPAFLLMLSISNQRSRPYLVAATFIAATPWFTIAPFPVLFIPVAVMATVFVRSLRQPQLAAALGAASFLALTALCVTVVVGHRPDVVVPLLDLSGNPLAEVSWRSFVENTSVPAKPWYLLAKIPTLVAFTLLLVTLTVAAFRSQRHDMASRLLPCEA